MTFLYRAFVVSISATAVPAASVDEMSFIQVGVAAKPTPTSGGDFLAEYRRAVQTRPSPPLASVPVAEVQWMKLPSAQTAERQAELCQTLTLELWGGAPWLQEPIFIHGGHALAIKAMKQFATSPQVQVNCANLLASVVQYNWVLARAVADAGALEAIVAAMRNFPAHRDASDLRKPLAAFIDFDDTNRKRLVELGTVEQAYSLADRQNSSEGISKLYDFLSLMCNIPEATERMVEQGELERGVRAMNYSRSTYFRATVLKFQQKCMMGSESRKEGLVKAGIVPEILTLISDEASLNMGLGQLEGFGNGKTHIIANAVRMLKELAMTGPRFHRAFLQAGGLTHLHNLMEESTNDQDYAIWKRQEVCEILAELLSGDQDEESKTLFQSEPATKLVAVLTNDELYHWVRPRVCVEATKKLEALR